MLLPLLLVHLCHELLVHLSQTVAAKADLCHLQQHRHATGAQEKRDHFSTDTTTY
jgi:hypothetical protein